MRLVGLFLFLWDVQGSREVVTKGAEGTWRMWWKESFRVSRETFNFICATVGPKLDNSGTVTSAIADERPLVAYSGI